MKKYDLKTVVETVSLIIVVNSLDRFTIPHKLLSMFSNICHQICVSSICQHATTLDQNNHISMLKLEVVAQVARQYLIQNLVLSSLSLIDR